jgi:hypothetical protein
MSSEKDITRIRELARRVKDIAGTEKNQRLIAAYQAINSLNLVPPPVHFFPPYNAIDEHFELRDCRVEDPFLRYHEAQMLQIIRRDEKLGDDQPAMEIMYSGYVQNVSPWMDNIKYHHFTTLDHGREMPKSYFEPCLVDEGDFEKMKPRVLSYNREKTKKNYERLAEAVGGILPVVMGEPFNGSCFGWGENLMSEYVVMRGLEQTYYDFYDHPDLIHRAMGFMMESKKAVMQQREEENMLCLNNTGLRIASSSIGYTSELPAPGYDPSHVRKCDLWGHADVQELSEVSPEMLEEFVMPYEAELLNGFGLVCYGCCEPMEHKIAVAERYIKNLRMISFNPFTDYARAAEQCRGKYVCAWKPSSAYMINFNEEENRNYLRDNLKLMKGCCVTITLEDTLSYGNDLSRFKRWVEIAREVVNGLY